MARSILVIDDERNMRWVLARALEKAGYEAVTAENGPAGLQAFARHSIDLVLLDLKMPGMDGLAVLRELRSRSRETPILLLTAYATIPTAVEALQAGASDYVRKPFNLETILSQINRFLAQQTDRQAEAAPAAALPAGFAEFVGAAPAVSKPLAQAAAAAQTTYPVLLCGEAGSGRRHLARLIYRNAAPAQPGRLAELDCAGVPAAILQKELLDESAAENGRRWQQTLGGTLLLANVEAIEEAMLPALAAHLRGYLHSAARPHGLRLLLTASAPLPAAWGPLLEEAFVIELPPLRARREDIPLLRRFFAPDARWSAEARAYLDVYAWPGNVAELRRVVEQAALPAGDALILPEHLPGQLTRAPLETPGVFTLPPEGLDLEQLEEELIRQAIAVTRGNKSQAARLLGLSRATLLYRLEKYAIGDGTGNEIGDARA